MSGIDEIHAVIEQVLGRYETARSALATAESELEASRLWLVPTLGDSESYHGQRAALDATLTSDRIRGVVEKLNSAAAQLRDYRDGL